jgi:hypothetical protein
VAINPPSDIVLGSVLAADPLKYQAAADRLRRTAGEVRGLAATAAATRSGSASPPGGGAAKTTSASAPTTTRVAAAAAGRPGKPPDAFAQLEAFVLQAFIQTMLPKDSQNFFGKGTAGEVWKSMLAEKLGAQIASSNQVGLAKQLAAGRGGAPAPALPAAALGGWARMPSSLTSILPYIQGASLADDALAGDSAAAAERS